MKRRDFAARDLYILETSPHTFTLPDCKLCSLQLNWTHRWRVHLPTTLKSDGGVVSLHRSHYVKSSAQKQKVRDQQILTPGLADDSILMQFPSPVPWLWHFCLPVWYLICLTSLCFAPWHRRSCFQKHCLPHNCFMCSISCFCLVVAAEPSSRGQQREVSVVRVGGAWGDVEYCIARHPQKCGYTWTCADPNVLNKISDRKWCQSC